MSDGLSRWLHPERPPRILIVGDMILDRYQYGSTERVSPEAPIVVLLAGHEHPVHGAAHRVKSGLRHRLLQDRARALIEECVADVLRPGADVEADF